MVPLGTNSTCLLLLSIRNDERPIIARILGFTIHSSGFEELTSEIRLSGLEMVERMASIVFFNNLNDTFRGETEVQGAEGAGKSLLDPLEPSLVLLEVRRVVDKLNLRHGKPLLQIQQLCVRLESHRVYVVHLSNECVLWDPISIETTKIAWNDSQCPSSSSSYPFVAWRVESKHQEPMCRYEGAKRQRCACSGLASHRTSLEWC
ncbi:hypothetical protein P152DRAFT_324289 [Eremomyces bilateralis CBS 781.70]|uniref:Uncharacterized protein n=1 Tax=Eremomyces bilateralis CBS 781.70 TaxID=1392243 RepID=A0A6G1FQ13_9PEZI|nr:uncharacterized protein P152DRAFT_324289 [Eremomyces bilateralis CBS 781.70]KAF1807818.1 hypothetical protein P152DRAFT_324289 [Eremomyces bilateralis CBS 781.70]